MDIVNPFGFVAGRWAFATADTAGDPDRAPDYIPASGASITFTPETPRQVVPDSPGWTGVINKRVVGKLNEEGRLVDAEGHNHFALGVGTYAVHYYFGNGIKWPSHRIQVTEAHTASNPLWLPPMPAPPDVPGAVNRTIQVPADGTDGQVLVWDGATFVWDFPPTGPQGPKGDSDVEQLAGTPRLTNLVHDMTWGVGGNATIDSETTGAVAFTATARSGHIRWTDRLQGGSVYYYTAEVKTTSDRVFFGPTVGAVFHSGSGDWERLTGTATPTSITVFRVNDNRESGWDQIEVRDPVLIDLTAVFGAGREPTAEYMDALLAKHGNYIGGVDQFAVGDALQTLTVAGPGMTLRHDTTVGERVFLDHPGGSTMLYGDTGWRRIPATSVQIAGLTEMFIRRTTHHLHAIIRSNATPTPGSWEVIATLPPGFRTGSDTARSRVPFANLNAYSPESTRPPYTAVVFGGEVRLRMEGSARLHATLTTYAEPAWPDALPGTPA